VFALFPFDNHGYQNNKPHGGELHIA